MGNGKSIIYNLKSIMKKSLPLSLISLKSCPINDKVHIKQLNSLTTSIDLFT